MLRLINQWHCLSLKQIYQNNGQDLSLGTLIYTCILTLHYLTQLVYHGQLAYGLMFIFYLLNLLLPGQLILCCKKVTQQKQKFYIRRHSWGPCEVKKVFSNLKKVINHCCILLLRQQLLRLQKLIWLIQNSSLQNSQDLR